MLLIVEFSTEEVKNAIFSCDNMNSPGPDDFNFGFLKDFWDVYREDLMKMMFDFHRHGKLVCGVNPSFIVLIPKKEKS